MHRNLDRRVEVQVKLPEAGLVAEVDEMLDLAFAPDTAAWELRSDGEWTQNRGSVAYQEALIERHRRRRTSG